MDRYIISEQIAPFGFGLGLFSGLGVAIGSLFYLVRQVTEAEISALIAVKILFLQLPYFVTFSIPIAVLLASLLAYSRLSSNSEIVALRSCGVSVQRLLLPTLIISLLLSIVTFVFNDSVVPAANYEATLTLEKAFNEAENIFQQKENIIYPEYRDIEDENGNEREILSRLFYAERFDGKDMQGLTILDYSRTDLRQIVVAESARWNPERNLWDFFNGTIYVIGTKGEYHNIAQFDRHRLPIPRAPLDLAAQARDYSEMTIRQARELLDALRYSGDDRKIRKLKIRIQQKIAIPFACVAFALLGSTLGLRAERSSRSTGFGTSVIATFTYYLLMSLGDVLGLSGVVSPAIAGWLPTLSCFGFGIFLLFRLD
ncbi:YjgP/YjgQ family permease [bacterium]|nr:YjgP/YjgQ family permease [bacterium]